MLKCQNQLCQNFGKQSKVSSKHQVRRETGREPQCPGSISPAQLCPCRQRPALLAWSLWLLLRGAKQILPYKNASIAICLEATYRVNVLSELSAEMQVTLIKL